jgi:hypothetical protein
MSRTMSFYDLRDALAQPDCAVCRLTAKAGDQYLKDLLWENVNDLEVRHNIRQARGFCHEHAWALAQHRASLGATIIMHDVLQNVLRTMEGTRFQTLPILSLRRTQEALDPKQPAAATAEAVAQLAPQQRCPVCVGVETMEKIYLSDLVENLLGEEGLITEFQSSDGLCLSHFRGALTYVRDVATFEALVGAQRATWERLVNQLSEIIRKSDYRFRDEEPGEERGASLRAIAALSGAQRDKDRMKMN